jgi:hypothetical protein
LRFLSLAEYYSNKIDLDNLKDWKGEEITEEGIRKSFEMLKETHRMFDNGRAYHKT